MEKNLVWDHKRIKTLFEQLDEHQLGYITEDSLSHHSHFIKYCQKHPSFLLYGGASDPSPETELALDSQKYHVKQHQQEKECMKTFVQATQDHCKDEPLLKHPVPSRFAFQDWTTWLKSCLTSSSSLTHVSDTLDCRHIAYAKHLILKKKKTIKKLRRHHQQDALDSTDQPFVGLTLQEFEQAIIEKEASLLQVFQKIDTNGNFSIQKNELKRALSTAGKSIYVDSFLGLDSSSHELHVFFSHLNQDDDDSCISYLEWRDFFLFTPASGKLKDMFKFYRESVFNMDTSGDIQGIIYSFRSKKGGEMESRIKYFIAGGIAGAVSRTATAPLDRIRVYLQTCSSQPTTTFSWFKSSSSVGILSSAKTIYTNGGISNFYRGNGMNVLKVFPESAIKFFVFEYCKSLIASINSDSKKEASHYKFNMMERFIAGGSAGLVSQFVIYPMETIKIRMMAEIGHQGPATSSSVSNPHRASYSTLARHSYSTLASERGSSLVWRTIQSIYREGGVSPFYRGCMPSLIGIIPYAGIDLMVFETLKATWATRHKIKAKEVGVGPILVFGMVSGTISASIMYPFSIIRTRLQAQGTPSHPQRYSSAWDAVKKTYQKESMRGFYKGIIPTLLKVVPSVSISYATYEGMKSFLRAA